MFKRFLDWYNRKNRIVQVGDVYMIERYYGFGYWGRMDTRHATLRDAEEDVRWWQKYDRESYARANERVIKTYR